MAQSVYTFYYSDGRSKHNEETIYGAKSREDAMARFKARHTKASKLVINKVKEDVRRTTYEIVTDRILEQMSKGVIPWQRPWHGVLDGAVSYSTGRPYSLLNQMLLGRPGEYLTFNQIHELGGRIRKGAKAGMVTFVKTCLKNRGDDASIPDDDDENTPEVERYRMLRFYNVFHIEDTEGIKSRIKEVVKPSISPIQSAEEIVNGYVARTNLKLSIRKSNKAYYSPPLDEVVVPLLEQYDAPEEYYSTLFHELTHSTGHKSRLDREEGMHNMFGDHQYSKEELVAEIGAAMLCDRAGIESEKAFRNSVGYLQSWMEKLKNDDHLIVNAAAKAEKAAKFILNISEETTNV